MDPSALKAGIVTLFVNDTPSGLNDALSGSLWRGTGKIDPSAVMPYGVFDLLGFERNDTMGSTDEVQFQEGTVQFTFWSDSDDDTEIDNIQGLASALYDHCGTDRQDTIAVSGWTITFFSPGPVTSLWDENNPEKYQLVMDYAIMMQKNN